MSDPPKLERAAAGTLPWPRSAAGGGGSAWSVAAATAAAATVAKGADWQAWVAWGAVAVLAVQAACAAGLSAMRKNVAGCAGAPEAAPKIRPDGLVLAYVLDWDVADSEERTAAMPARQQPGGWFTLSFVPDSDALSLDLALRDKRANAALLGNAPVVLRPAGAGTPVGGGRVVVEARYAPVQGRVAMPVPCIDASAMSKPPEFGDGKGARRMMTLMAFSDGGHLR